MFTTRNLTFLFTVLSLVFSALMGGVFFAFSTFVMPGINKLSTENAVRAMQSINESVPSSLFGAAFTATPVFCLLSMLFCFWMRQENFAGWVFAGGTVYLIMSLTVTLIFNIPLNNEMSVLSPNAADISQKWLDFFQPWQFWNHVRTLGSMISIIFYLIAFYQQKSN